MQALTNPGRIPAPTARLAIGAAAAVILLLASLHVLSPEFDPRWRVVSEYANGNYGWACSWMFAAGALSDWALGFAVWSQVRNRSGRTGLLLLIASGIGGAMASVFDINHPLHNVAGAIGVLTIPLAVPLISVALTRSQPWSAARKQLFWTSNLIWISLVLFIVTTVILATTCLHAGGQISSKVKQLPPGVIALNGWPNRFFVVACSVWVMAVARQAIRMSREARASDRV